MSNDKSLKTEMHIQLPDFRTDGPPLFKCGLCGKRYKIWHVDEKEWDKLSPEYRSMAVCEDDFLRLLRKAGHSTSHITIERDRPWKRLQKLWAATKDMPAPYARIRFPLQSWLRHAISDTLWCEEQLVAVEWCEVMKTVGDRKYHAQLLNPVELDKKKSGSLYLTEWDGKKVDPVSGRPVLDVVSLISTVSENVIALREPLEERLLSLGGKTVDWREPEPNRALILEKGALFTQPVQVQGLGDQLCHRMASKLWADDPKNNQLVTGYALSSDCWFSHSWILRDETIIETASGRHESYFGVVLPPTTALEFCINNFLGREYPDKEWPQQYNHLLPIWNEYLAEYMAKPSPNRILGQEDTSAPEPTKQEKHRRRISNARDARKKPRKAH